MNPSLILYPLSLLPSGKAALGRALEIARWHDAEVHVLLVRGRRASLAPVAMPLADARREPRLARSVDAINPRETRVSIVELTGDPVAAVSDYARQTAADLIVVAKHGRPYGTYWRPGAYATDLARAASCPTLAVPETEAAAPNIDRVVMGSAIAPALVVPSNRAERRTTAAKSPVVEDHVDAGFVMHTDTSGRQILIAEGGTA